MVFWKKSLEDVAQLKARHSSLQTRLAAATTAREAARAEHTEQLISGDEDIKPRANKLVECERAESAIRDAIAEIETRIDNASNRLAKARDIELREEAAGERERAADAVEKAALQLERSIEVLSKSFEDLVAAIPDDSGAKVYEPLIGPRPATGIEVARAILGEGLFKRCGDMCLVEGPAIGFYVNISLPVYMRRPDRALDRNILKNDGSVKFLPARKAANETIVKPLRQSAQELRDGERPLPAPEKATLPAVVEPAPPEMTGIIFLRPCTWRAANGVLARSQEPEDYRRAHVPAFVSREVAAAAVAAGAAIMAGSEEAECLRHTAYFPRSSRIPDTDYLALNVDWPSR